MSLNSRFRTVHRCWDISPGCRAQETLSGSIYRERVEIAYFSYMVFRTVLIVVFLVVAGRVSATHNRSGDITYRYLYGNTYAFTITTCTKLSSEANRDELEIYWGDGQMDTLPRTLFYDFPATDTKQNYYTGQHTFTGPGTFTIYVQDPNRNANVLNITNSVDKIFCVQTQLVISPFLGTPNNSVRIEDCPCPEIACSGKPWLYNMGAYDPDGDSLTYSLIPCKGENCLDMPIPSVYHYPQDVGGGMLSIDPVSGTLNWSSPTLIGEYNLAILVREFRQGIAIGYVIRDMQVTVQGVCQNNPPEIVAFNDTCLFAGDTILAQLSASDSPATPNDNPYLDWDYYGEGYSLNTHPAVFNPSAPGNPISGDFSWNPGCEEVRASAYSYVFEAYDDGPNVSLKDIFTWRIRVNLPPVENLAVAPVLNTMELTWDAADCPNIVGYRIYRNTDSVAFTDDCCEKGLAQGIGYTLIASVPGRTNTQYTDETPVAGNRYCYLVTAVSSNGSESCLPEQVCSQLRFELPVLTHVTIDQTDVLNGSDTIRWSPPRELDQAAYPGPYTYVVYESDDTSVPATPVFTSSTEVNLLDCDTIFYRTGINTTEKQYTYSVELLSGTTSLGRSTRASSIFLTLIPNDNQLELTWNVEVPWTNTLFEIYRESSPGSGVFNLIGSTSGHQYTDTALVNGQMYCYRVRSTGNYSLSQIPNPLRNWSQTACGIPTDLTPPCSPPAFQVFQDCDKAFNLLSWSNPNNSCSDDAVSYHVYYSPYEDSAFQQIASIDLISDTNYVFADSLALSGCFYVTASDSVQYGNESVPADTICLENCTPVFNLPNVFTPNGDLYNATYHPLFPKKFVDSISFTVLNRWGQEVFETSDPDINWNGYDTKSNKLVTNGVYFYICRVFVESLEGKKEFVLHGNITVIY